jgi:hypothetical protein
MGFTVGCNADRIVPAENSPVIGIEGSTASVVGPCEIIATPPPGTLTFYDVSVPSSGTACDVGWTMSYPPIIDRPNEYTYHWQVFSILSNYPYAGAPEEYFWESAYGDIQNGPNTITFSKPIKNVTVLMIKINNPGHYMVAFNSLGQEIARDSFQIAGSDWDEKTLALGGIKKLVIYPVILGQVGNDFTIDGVGHHISFEVEPDPPPLLTCTPAPTRGADVTCTVSGTGVAVTGWTFTGPAYNNPTTILRVTAAGGSNSWIGPAITSGDVAAQVTVNGVPRSTPVISSFTVQQRTGNAWTWGPNLHWKYTQGTGKNCFSGTMDYFEGTVVGWNRRTGGCEPGMLTPDPFTSTKGYTVNAPTSGPNSGIWYVTGLTYQMLRESQINQAVTPTSTLTHTLVDASEKAECSANAGKPIAKANFYFFNDTCKRLDVAGYVAGIWRHEGYGTTNGSGHQAQFEMAASLVEYSLYNNEEAVYAITQADARAAVVALARLIDNGIRMDGGHEEPVDGKNWVGDLFLWAQSQLKFINRLIYT